MSKEAEKLARDCEESADIWANEIDTRRKAAALLRRQAEQIRGLRLALSRVVASDDAHSTLHASDGDDVARMIEYAAAFDCARSALAATKEET